MNSEDFKNLIKVKKPRYAKSRIPVLEAFANKGKSKSEYSQFGPIYELYIYAFVLGLKKKMYLPLPTRNLTADFVEIAKWKSGSSLVDFLIMILFTHCDDIGFNWNELEDMEEKRPQQPTDAPVRHELYHGYLDIRNNLKNYTNDRRIESGTD